MLRTWPCATAPGPEWVSWRSETLHLGSLRPERAQALHAALPDSYWEQGALVWPCDAWSSSQRSTTVQAGLERARADGALTGWRNEAFAFWHSGCPTPLAQTPYLTVERAGFRYLGLMSHAVHINGFTPDGRLWCGRRAAHKATDPGMLDNVTAGGLPAGETMLGCALRELQEEAGLLVEVSALEDAGLRRTSRAESEGWHDEILQVYNLTLDPAWQPINQDGEVQEFACLSATEVLHRIQRGEFTVDATASLAQGLGLATTNTPAPR